MKPAAAWHEIVARSNREGFKVVNSRQKGKRGEAEWRDVLRAAGWTEARRGQQFRGGPDSPDVMCGPRLTHCEVKVREQHNPWAHIAQAEAEAATGCMPYVAMKKNRKPWLVVLRAEDFLMLLRNLEHHEAEAEKAESPV